MAIAFVHEAGGTVSTPGATCTVTISTTQGNFVAVAVFVYNASQQPTAPTVTDSSSGTNTYQGTGSSLSTANGKGFIYAGIQTSAVTSITITPSNSGDVISASALEFSGVAATLFRDTFTGASGSSTAPATGTTSATTRPNEVSIAVVGWSGIGALSAGSAGYVAKPTRTSNAISNVKGSYNLLSATGTQAYSATLSVSGQWIAIVAIYKDVALVTSVTGTDAPAALTESFSKSIRVARTEADSIAALSDTASRSALSFTRSETDAIDSIAETFTRSAMIFTRAETDAINSIVEAFTRILNFARVESDGLSAPSEASSRALNFVRNASEPISAVRETITRGLFLSRIFSEPVAALVESAVKSSIFQRAYSESINPTLDTAVQSSIFGRATADTIQALSDIVGRIQGFSRNTSDAVSTPADSSMRSLIAPRSGLDVQTVPSETLSRSPLIFIRAGIDGISAVVDTVQKRVVRFLTSSDAIAAPVDAVFRVFTNLRTSTDSISVPGESMTKASSFVRSFLDALLIPADSSQRQSRAFRTSSESISAPSDSFIRAPIAFARGVAESVPTLIESLIGHFLRDFIVRITVSDSAVLKMDATENSIVSTSVVELPVLDVEIVETL